ncbi:beta-galactosidase [Eisenbergiella tayi]|uniref:beta-galactosidase n=1 Tax=Eisenbergiella tayi TaxID=1432052 RepID=UPI0009C00CC9|nr:beta-galactosidase [Eisenbergiella tayi]
MEYHLSLENINAKTIYPLGKNFSGRNNKGEQISFTNYYMQKNEKPFFGISGEFHFSRMSDARWEDELIKMKMGGINVIATYVFWIHHEEEEGCFDFSGCRNLGKFVRLCQKHGLYVILRVGPFDHGEVRNGGIPDWMYGKPFEVRKISEGFLYYTRRLYSHISEEVSGLFFKDNGPIIGVQIDNEYMHSSAPWEITTGISNEWVFGGDEGEAYMLRLKDLAAEVGLTPVFYTCTGWGGAAVPDSMMPLWGGYAFRPWIFYSHKGEHPATEEYVYQDFHNNQVECTNDFKPQYKPEERPYACCEMGGGMTCCYYYRFQYPFKSVDAMANIKIASGCNFLGYYMFQGGSNPVGKNGTFLNEGQVPKISYDYQAALGEFGQVRESYRRLKSIHYFTGTFADRLCSLRTVLPEGASEIAPKDVETLRYAIRTDGKRGFVFINNYQDHMQMPDRQDEQIILHLEKEDISYSFGIAGDENAILPFHLDMEGIDLISATAQPVTLLKPEGDRTYVFMVPDGMQAAFQFEAGVSINGEAKNNYCCKEATKIDFFHVTKGKTRVHILVVSREMANQMYVISNNRLIFTQETLMENQDGLQLETISASNMIYTYPAIGIFDSSTKAKKIVEHEFSPVLDGYVFETEERVIIPKVTQISEGRYTIELQENFMGMLKDARLQLVYSGDIGHAFIDGKMINDNFSNGAVWEIGLKDFQKKLVNSCITVYITPLKEGVNVNVESAMAARREEVTEVISKLYEAYIVPVYQITLD